MTTNVGTIDRSLRAVIGFVMLTVAAVKMCPIYSIFGFKTCREC